MPLHVLRAGEDFVADPTSVGCHSLPLSGLLGRHRASSRLLVQPRHRFRPGIRRLWPRVPLIHHLHEVAVYLDMRYTIDSEDRGVVVFHYRVLPFWLRDVLDRRKRHRLRLKLRLLIRSLGGIGTLERAIEDERHGLERVAHDGRVVLGRKRNTLPFSEHGNMDTQRSVRLPMSFPISKHPEACRLRNR